MRAWTILVFLVIFNLSFGVVSALDIGRTPEGENPIEEGSDEDFISNLNIMDESSGPNYLALIGTLDIALALIAATLLNLPVGAAIYAGLAGVNLFSLGSILQTLENYSEEFVIMQEMEVLLAVALGLLFLWGFIDLAS